MTAVDRSEVTDLLRAWTAGKDGSLEKLVPLVYAELRRLAHRYMRGEHMGHTLQTSALINEAYLRLIDSARVKWQDRAHFLAVSAQLMRRVLVDFARTRRSRKRGGEEQRIPLDEALNLHHARGADLIRLDDALNEFAKEFPRKAQVIELRFFGGLSVEETAEALHVSEDTVTRDWRMARVWLHRALNGVGRHAK